MALTRSNKLQLFGTFLLAVIDIVLSTLLFVHGINFRETFLADVYLYTFTNSKFDLWVFGLTRTSILLGGILGFIRNPSKAGERMLKVRILVLIIAVAMWELTVIKLLVLSSHTRDLRLPWFWSMFAWNNLCPAFFYLSWMKLANMKVCDSASIEQSKTLNVNTDEEERQPLLGNNTHNGSVKKDEKNKDETEEDDDKTGKEKAVTIGRLFRYSRPDWYILLCAFIFLCVSSTGQFLDPLCIELKSGSERNSQSD